MKVSRILAAGAVLAAIALVTVACSGPAASPSAPSAITNSAAATGTAVNNPYPTEPPPPPPPPTGNCSPGFYKNHVDYWWGIYCDDTTAPTCETLLTALTCRGSDASCGRSDAAAFLNALSGCTEDD